MLKLSLLRLRTLSRVMLRTNTRKRYGNLCVIGYALSALLISLPQYAVASTFDTLEDVNQAQFISFSKSLSAATHYKSVSPPESLGSLGFDIGLVISSTDVDGALFDLASDGDFKGSDLIIPRVHVHKGLPFGLDIGASLSAVPDSDASIIGGELRFAIVKGSALSPAVGLRGTYATLQGVDDFGLKSTGLELSISKGFLVLTPYAGVGVVRSTANPKAIDGLSAESYEQKKLLVGITANLGFALTLEADRTGDFRTYSIKTGVRF